MRKLKRDFKKWEIVVLAVFLLGLIGGLILVQRPQLYRPKAEVDLTKAFEIKDSQGRTLNCGNNTCETTTLEVILELKDPNVFNESQ